MSDSVTPGVLADAFEDLYCTVGSITQLGFAVQLGTVRFLDDTDRERVRKRRVAHTQLGFAVQLGTVRFLGLFLEEPIQVPPLVVDYVAGHPSQCERDAALDNLISDR